MISEEILIKKRIVNWQVPKLMLLLKCRPLLHVEEGRNVTFLHR